MDPQNSAQDIVRCDLCETPIPPLFCDFCDINLCKDCVEEHLSDKSREHKVVPFEKRRSAPKCPIHSTKLCELHCEKCNIPICLKCVSSEHQGHKTVESMKVFTSRKETIKKDLQELENSIYPQYLEAALKIVVQKADVSKHSQKLKAAFGKQGEALHNEIDSIIKSLQSEIDDMDSNHLAAIDKLGDTIKSTVTKIEQCIDEIKTKLDADDVYFVSAYKSKNDEFRKLPSQVQVSLPVFTPQEINREQIYQQFGSLSMVGLATEEHGDSINSPGAMSSSSAKQLNDEPRILTEIKTKHGEGNELRSVSCFNDSEFWTGGDDKVMRLYDLKGKLLQSLQTKSGNWPWDIAVIRSGDLVYTDPYDKSVNILQNTQIAPLIRLLGWIPLYLCSSSSGELLVTIRSVDKKQTKVVRYSGSVEKQSIQWDDKGQPLYSSDIVKYISENRNLDICVTDFGACAVVVVSAAGKLRFRYTGPRSNTNKPFKPFGIATDSQGRILTADGNNHRIHILDQDGHFLRFIENCSLHIPCGLCMDSRDNLFVAEYNTGIVKKIKFYK